MASYEAPTIVELGSVADFTQGEGFWGDHDSLFIFGYDTGIDYGQSPSS